MQGPIDEGKCDLLTHMKVDYRGKSAGTCNVCSALCSSCFHMNKVLLKSKDESAGETCVETVEIGLPYIRSTVTGINSSSDSFSEIAVGKGSSMAPDASASDDSVVQSKSEYKRVSEANDDCFSCASGTDEHASRKSNTEEDSRIKYNTQNKISGESSDALPSSLQSGLCIQNPRLVEAPLSKSTDATDLLKVQNTLSQDSNQIPMNVKDDVPSDTKNELLEGSTEHLIPLSAGVLAPADHPGTFLNSIEKNDDMELEMHPVNETDDSDMVEQDVKVCDICGDAGREDLLAICCRCSDGAEHTYCMREMLAKVPEGEWLCEECKNVERVSNGRREKAGIMDENEKNNSSGQASSEHVNSDVDGHKKGHTKNLSKRLRDDADAEVSSIAKKPALESIVGSPKSSNTSKPAVISRESSSKNLVKARLQASHHSSSGTVQVNDTTEPSSSASDLRAHGFRGAFSKSNSFNSLNSKRKVKPVDQIVLQRQKSAREYGSIRLKEGAVRSIGKSLSFKSTNASQTETKMKMISPRLSENTQDIKNMKQRTPFELQRLSRAENSSSNSIKGTSVSPTSRIDKRLVSRGESSVTTIANHHEMKPAQSEGKSAALSRTSSLAGRRTSDLPSSLGELKRPLIFSHNNSGVSSANGVTNIEKRSNHSNLKEEMSSSVLAERPPLIANEPSGSRFIPPCIKSSRDESDNLKAAIEAAVLKKPGVYRKHRGFGQPDDPSLSVSAGKKKLSCDAELPDGPTVSQSLNADSFTEGIPNNLKQSGEGALPSEGQDDIYVGPSSRDAISDVSATVPLLLKSLAIPEHEYIWQGCFEVYRGGKLFDLWEGIQAHVSTCTSPKVVEAAKKFKNRIVLYEVPRLSTWPIHFQEHGVTEDSVALFFFARDLESYEKIYKVLLDNMMKNDLALKGNVNGVELLIFPSNQLRDNSQRWNMLFFLWGVFRGRKENCLQHRPESLKQFGPPRDIPPPIMSLPDNRCSLKPIAEDLLVIEDATPVLSAPTSEKLQSSLSSRRVNGDFGAKDSFLDQLDHSLSCSSPAALQSGTENNCQEMKGPCQGGGVNPSSRASLAMENSGREPMLMHLDMPLDRLQPSHHSRKAAAGNIADNMGEGTILDIPCTQNQAKLRTDARDPSRDGETLLKNDWFTRDLNVEPDNGWSFNHKECMPSGSYVAPQTLYAAASPLSRRSHETRGALEKVNHLTPGSDSLQSPRHETCVDTLIGECHDNAERHFFPIEYQPEKGGNLAERSLPWKMHLPEQDQEQLSDRAPNLELALGAEKCPRSLEIQSLLINKVDQKVNEEHILKEAAPKTEDDVSATLSLSLSFPFPEKELTSTEPAAPKTGRLLSERERMSTSMLLFGDLGDS